MFAVASFVIICIIVEAVVHAAFLESGTQSGLSAYCDSFEVYGGDMGTEFGVPCVKRTRCDAILPWIKPADRIWAFSSLAQPTKGDISIVRRLGFLSCVHLCIRSFSTTFFA